MYQNIFACFVVFDVEKGAPHWGAQKDYSSVIDTLIKIAPAEIISNAQGKAKEMRRAAQDFVDDIMRRADEGLTSNLGEIRKTRAALKQQSPASK